MARPGDRVRLVSITDPHVTLQRGTLGTVDYVDDMGTVHVSWDDGTKLGMVPDEDAFELAAEPTQDRPGPE